MPHPQDGLLALRADPEVAPIHQEVHAVFLRRDRELVRRAHDFEAGGVQFEASQARESSRGVPCTMMADSCERWSAVANTSSPTAALDITAWMNPDPSLTCEVNLPLDRLPASQP